MKFYEYVEYILESKLNESPTFNALDKRSKKIDDTEFEEALTDYHIGYKDPTRKFRIGKILYGVWDVKRDDSGLKNEVYFGFENDRISRDNAVIFCGVSYNKKFDFPMPGYILVRTDARGKKLGYDFYEYLVEHFGGIVSDNSLSENIFKIYSKISEKYNLYFLNGQNLITKSKTKLSISDMNEYGETFMITKEKLDPVEWNKL
jgi:hypothetical protein